MTQTHAHKRHERGQALAEFSLILPILFIVIFGIFDFGRVLFVFSDASGSVRDAARKAEILGSEEQLDLTGPTYVACDTIRNTALATGFATNEVVDVYYFDTTDPAGSGLTPVSDWNPTNHTDILTEAHYSCEGGSTLPKFDDTYVVGTIPTVNADGSELENGDLMRVHYTARVKFFTPFLSAMVSGIDINFYAQRSIVTKLTIGSSGGIDYDYDGLDDRWELMWYGCDDGTTIRKIDTKHHHEPLSNWESWTIQDSRTVWSAGGFSVALAVYPIQMVGPPATVYMPEVVNTTASNAVSDTGW